MHEISVPKLNSNDASYILVEWLAGDGDEVAADTPIAVVETSKAAEELEAGHDGVLQRALAVNADCGIGAVIGRLFPTEQARTAYIAAAVPAPDIAAPGPAADDIVITKAARQAAAELGVDLAGLAFPGKKVVKRDDIEQLAGAAAGTVISLSAAQRAVGQVVTTAQQSIPAAFAMVKIQVDAALRLQAGQGAGAHCPVGLPELLIKAVGGLRGRFDWFFGRYQDNGTISLTAGAQVGVTLDAGQGLYVPVVKDADTRSLAEIADVLADFRISALRGSFRESELAGGNITISLSNDPDIVLARPIIFPGQACMLCLCGTQQELYLSDAEQIAVRHYANLGLSYDHRVINGRDAALFLRGIKNAMAEPGTLR